MTSRRTASGTIVFTTILATVFATLAIGMAGCATSDLERAGGADAVSAALHRSAPVATTPVNEQRRPIAYLALAGTKGSRLAAFDLTQSRLVWIVPARLTGRIVAGASLVVHADGDHLVARSATAGNELWRHAVTSGETLVGYAVDGNTTYYVARQGNELRGGQAELVALSPSSGAVVWRRALGTSNVAGPAARGGIVAVPNRSQFIDLFDGGNGDPLARALSKEQAANFVEASPEGFFYGYGADGAYLLSGDTAIGVRSSPGYLRAKFPSFVRPVYHFDMYRPELANYSAIDRNRILWRARVEGARASFADGTVCVLNYRFFFGFDAQSGALRWAYNHPAVEAVGAAHTGAAILFATADGEVGALEPRSGRALYRARLPGEVIVGVTFDAEGYAPPPGEVVPTPPLSAVLSSMVWDPDRRFSEVQVFAVDQLARLPGREVTADLLKMLSKEGMSLAVTRRAARALVERQDSDAVDLFVGALRVHADYADATRPSNLDVLARVVGALKAKEAAEPLAEHLRLPETDSAAVVEIARALASIGVDTVLPRLRDYLTVYRADPAFGADASALLAVADALVKLGGPTDRALLLYLAEDVRTVPALAEYARRALIQTAPQGTPPSAAAAAAVPRPAKVSDARKLPLVQGNAAGATAAP